MLKFLNSILHFDMECRALQIKITTFREVIPYRLYICAANDVTHENIEYFKITHIINCSYSVPLYRKNGFKNSLRFAIKDRDTENILPYFEQFFDHVSRALNDDDARVLVHCQAGISRSPALVISFLMKHYRMSLKEAFEFMFAKRHFINPNLGFWKQLRDWDEKCFEKSSVKMINYRGFDIPDVVLKQGPKYYYFVLFVLANKQKQLKKKL